MKTYKLNKIPYGQVCVLVDDNGTTYLRSYSTIVAAIDSDNWLEVYGLYSATTRKHISAFMHEYATRYDYYTAKSLCQTHEKLNLTTGERRAR